MIIINKETINEDLMLVLPLIKNTTGGKNHLSQDGNKTLCGLSCSYQALADINDHHLEGFMNTSDSKMMNEYVHVCLRCAKVLQTAVFEYSKNNANDIWELEFNAFVDLKHVSHIASNSLTNLKKAIKEYGLLMAYIQCTHGSMSYGQDVVDDYPFMPRYTHHKNAWRKLWE